MSGFRVKFQPEREDTCEDLPATLLLQCPSSVTSPASQGPTSPEGDTRARPRFTSGTPLLFGTDTESDEEEEEGADNNYSVTEVIPERKGSPQEEESEDSDPDYDEIDGLLLSRCLDINPDDLSSEESDDTVGPLQKQFSNRSGYHSLNVHTDDMSSGQSRKSSKSLVTNMIDRLGRANIDYITHGSLLRRRSQAHKEGYYITSNFQKRVCCHYIPVQDPSERATSPERADLCKCGRSVKQHVHSRAFSSTDGGDHTVPWSYLKHTDREPTDAYGQVSGN